MSPEKKRVAKKAITSEESTADADEDDWNKSPIRTITWGRDAPVAVLFFSYHRLSTGGCLSVAVYIDQARNMKTV